MFRRAVALTISTLAVSLTALADFSYSSVQKTTGGSMAAMAGGAADRTSQYSFKGRKMMYRSVDNATILDFGAQTITTINNAQKTYTVKKFSDLTGTAVNADVSVDVKDTGQKKMVNGFNATEMILTMNIDMDAGRGGPPMKMQMEMDMWISADVPGAGEMRAFYKQNASGFPWAAMAGGGNPGMQRAMAQIQRKLAELDGVVVEQVIRTKAAGGAQAPQTPQMNAGQQDQMQAAMARLQEMAKQGGPAGAAAQQALGRMGGMSGASPAAGPGGSGSLIEMTIDSTGFSTAGVPDSLFAVPDGYKQNP
jgi:hypothetical protein